MKLLLTINWTERFGAGDMTRLNQVIGLHMLLGQCWTPQA
jgi:hypothetical protein